MSEIVARLIRELENGRHLLIIDLHRPHTHDPQGLHARLWEQVNGKSQRAGVRGQEPFGISSYRAGTRSKAYFHRIGLHATLPEFPFVLNYRTCRFNLTELHQLFDDE